MTTPKPSAHVQHALEAGWTPLAAGTAAVMWFYHRARPRDPGHYRVVDLRAGDRSVQVSISPTGRSVQVYVDGEQIPKAKP